MKPALRLLFPADLTEQKKKLMMTLGVAIKSLRETEKLIPVLENLGRKHALYGVRDEHYDTVGAALLQTLRDALGKEFTAEAHTAWAEMYGFVASTIQHGAQELAEQEFNSQETLKMPKPQTSTSPAPFLQPILSAAKTFVIALFCFLAYALSVVNAEAAAFTVTNVNDSGAGSLRQAITSANALPNEAHTITFNIGTGLKTINLASRLPTIALTNLTIDGTTQGGFANVPLIELNGASAGGTADGLKISSGVVTIKSLIINRFAKSGIYAAGSNLNIYGCFIGTDSNGSADLGNGLSGIYLQPADNTTINNIGGTGTNERNVISGNNGDGIYISGFYSADIKIVNNYIGTNASAIIDVGNSGNGIVIFDYQSNVSKVGGGGTLNEQRNVISGNDKNGIKIGLSQSATIQGNYIGLGANGLTAIGNTQNGINFSTEGATVDNVTIGGSTSTADNTISANGGDGIEVYYYDAFGLGTISPLIIGNRIGTDANGGSDRGNAQNGILVSGLASPKIGRENAGEGNTISGNDGSGVYFSAQLERSITIESAFRRSAQRSAIRAREFI